MIAFGHMGSLLMDFVIKTNIEIFSSSNYSFFNFSVALQT
jgi:hypothetical protein